MAGSTEKLGKLPPEIVDHMEKCAEAATHSAALKVKFDSEGGSGEELGKFNKEAELFTNKAKGLLSEDLCLSIRYLFFYQGWWAACKSEEKDEQAKCDFMRVNKYQEKINQSEAFTQELVQNLVDMGKCIAKHYAAKVCKHVNSMTQAYLAYSKDHKSNICGDVKLVAVEFFTNKAENVKKRPRVVVTETITTRDESGDQPDGQAGKDEPDQSMTFSYKWTKGTTRTITTNVGFEFGVNAGFSVGFSGMAEATLGVEFKISGGRSKANCFLESEEKTASFPLNCTMGSTYTCKGIVHEAEMDVPFKYVFDISGVKRCIHGVWTGVAVHEVTSDIVKV